MLSCAQCRGSLVSQLLMGGIHPASSDRHNRSLARFRFLKCCEQFRVVHQSSPHISSSSVARLSSSSVTLTSMLFSLPAFFFRSPALFLHSLARCPGLLQ